LNGMFLSTQLQCRILADTIDVTFWSSVHTMSICGPCSQEALQPNIPCICLVTLLRYLIIWFRLWVSGRTGSQRRIAQNSSWSRMVGVFQNEHQKLFACGLSRPLNIFVTQTHNFRKSAAWECSARSASKYQNIRIGHFSLSAILTSRPNICNSILDAPVFAAPEGPFGSPVTKRSDLWNLGVLLFVSSIGQLDFQDPNHERLFRWITSEDSSCPIASSTMLTDLFQRMLQKIRLHTHIIGGNEAASVLLGDPPEPIFDVSAVELLSVSHQ
jgi:hypothetical protein